MIKKIYISLALSTLYSLALADTQEQLAHIKTEIKKIVTSYRIALVTMTVLTKKTTPELAASATAAIDKVIASPKFKEDINKLTDSQCENIINGASYSAMDYKPSIADYSSQKYIPFSINLFNAMAKKIYRQLLWNKLIKKEKELETEQGQLDASA